MLETGHKRLDVIVSGPTGDQLSRLAKHYGIPVRTVIENLALLAESSVTPKLNSEKRDAYYASGRKRPQI